MEIASRQHLAPKKTVAHHSLFILSFVFTFFLAACGGGASGGDGSTTSSTTSTTSGGSGGSSGDTTRPTVTINTPVSSSTYTAPSSTLSLAGSASDNVGVTQVTWSNSLGGSGTASGTSSWSVSNVTLQSGSNVFTVTAQDAAGNTTADTLTVTYNVADTTPPAVSSTNPSNNAANVSVNSTIRATFSEAMNASSVTTGSFMVNGVSGSVIVSGTTATFTPSSALAYSTTYTVTIAGGTNGVKDAAGNALPSEHSWSFTTSAPLACNSSTVHCVDDTAGATQEYSSIQSAINAAQAGDAILVYDGNYQGFSISRSGTATNRITVRAEGSSVVIDRPNSSSEGITINNASYITIDGFTVANMLHGIATHNATATNPMHGLIIRNNIVHDSDMTNIYLSQVADSLIENNTAYNSAGSHGIYLANGGSDNTTLHGNVLYNNYKNGLHFNGDLSIGGDGMHSGLIVENNVIYDNVANGMDVDGVQDSLFQNNVVYNNGTNAIRAYGGGGTDSSLPGDSAAGPMNLKFINNTLLTLGHGGWPIKVTQDRGGHLFFNNILLSDRSSNGSLCVDNSNFASDNNAVVNRFSLDGDNTLVSLSDWQARGNDRASFPTAATDLFVSTGNSDYRLKAGAPAIDRGIGTFNGSSAPAEDILGVARSQGGGFDIGAYESY